MVAIDIEYLGNLSTRCVHRESGAEILTDAPKDNHGRGLLFSPTDLLAASLGSCFLTVMGIAAQKLQLDLPGAKIHVEKEMSRDLPRRISKITMVFSCQATFPPEVTAKLEAAAKGCPVHYSLHPDLEHEIHFIWGSTK